MPPLPRPTGWPVSSTMSAKMPGRGSVAEPGLVGVAPGSGEIMWPPVSVCHQVSTIGQRPPPTVSWYQIHASGLIGSPTRSEEHTSELQSRLHLVCRLLLEKKKRI